MEEVMSIEGDEDDSLLRHDPTRGRPSPFAPNVLAGGYRWFRSANVIPMERYRERRANLPEG
jgi:hypothetical protein